MGETIISYVYVLIGAYLIIWLTAIGDEPTWRTPLVWVAIWIIIEVVGYFIKKALRKRRMKKVVAEAVAKSREEARRIS